MNASRQVTADFFADADRVAACVPGVEGVTEVSPNNFTAVLAVRLGPIRAAFQGKLQLDDTLSPDRLSASGEGRDRSTGSMAKVEFTADLVELDPTQTTVRTVADITLRGKMAHFGTGVMRAAAGEMVKEFATCVNATLAEESQGAIDGADAAADHATTSRVLTPARSRGLVSIVARGVSRALAAKLRRGLARIRRFVVRPRTGTGR